MKNVYKILIGLVCFLFSTAISHTFISGWIAGIFYMLMCDILYINLNEKESNV